MFWNSPIWLLALLPWAALTVWLLWGRRQRTDVPFLELWREAAEDTQARRRMRVPPVAIALAIAAMLLAILAAGRPVLRGVGPRQGTRLTVIVDRGITMSAAADGRPRFVRAAEAASAELAKAGGANVEMSLLTVPGDLTPLEVKGGLAAAVAVLAPTARNTTEILRAGVAAQLAQGDGPVLVLTDQDLGRHDPRLVQITPEHAIHDIGIAMISARSEPQPQVMVRVRNHSSRTTAHLEVRSGDARSVRQIELAPSGGGLRDYFIDLPTLGDTVEASLDVSDDIPADDRAWLVRERSWPRVVAMGPINPELERMIAVYARHHPSSDASQAVGIVTDPKDLPSSGPAVLVIDSTLAAAATPSPVEAVTVSEHPLTRNVNWIALASTQPVTGSTVPAGWTPVVSRGGRAFVAVRKEPARQVWVAIDSPRWSASPDFVIFWANVFGWVGQGEDRFAAYNLAEAPAGIALPGIASDRGISRAYNAHVPEIFAVPPQPWEPALRAWGRNMERGLPLAPFAGLAALACLAGAAVAWRRKIRDRPLFSMTHQAVEETQAISGR